MRHTIQFNVSGYIEQAIEIVKEGVTIDDILEGLATGKMMTTTHEDGGSITDSLTDEVVASIWSTEDNVEYDDFTEKRGLTNFDKDGLWDYDRRW